MAQRKTTKTLRPVAEPERPAPQAAEETVVQVHVKPAATGHEQAAAETKERARTTSRTPFQGYDDLAGVGKCGFDAYIEFSTIFAKAMESLGKEVLDYAQSSLEANLVAAKGLMAAKTLEEAIDLQTGYTRDSIDSMIGEAVKLTELSVDLANQVMEPIQTRVTATTESLFKPLAA